MSDEPARYIESCAADRDLDGTDWWKYVIIYQIYPRSFQDSTGDGIGDLKGIISRLDHLVYLNVGAIWISPIYKSPMVDHGYDICDFRDIDPLFGTLGDFDQLLEECHKRKIKVIMDFVPNHTSDRHPWFINSCKEGEDNPYKDFYIWRDGKLNEKDGSIEPPNNWISLFGGSAWTWVEERKQYYLHTFAKEQPDLNYRDRKVLKEMKNVLKFWIIRGVDGFRVDAAVHIVKHNEFRDEPRSKNEKVTKDHPDYLDHIYTACQPEVHGLMSAFRSVLKKYYYRTGKYIFMATEVYQASECMKFYNSGSDMPLNLSFVGLKGRLTGILLKEYITPWIEAHQNNKWPNFTLGNHDQPRISTRVGEKFVDALNVLLLLLPGTPITYYGDEIGMIDIDVDQEDAQDPLSKNLGSDFSDVIKRDACRSPMQWNDSVNAGFSNAPNSWLPVHPTFTTRNVKNQLLEGAGSHLNVYRAASFLRQHDTFRDGFLEFSIANEDVFSFWRFTYSGQSVEKEACFLVTMNFGEQSVVCDYTSEYSKKGVVVLDTKNPENCGFEVPLSDVVLNSGQCVVLEVLFE